MYAKLLRTAPAAALVTLGLMLAGPAASAAPQQSTASVSAEQLRPNGKHGPYSSEGSCKKAGKTGQSKGHWKHYQCRYDHHQWWLYTS
ncbi:hypothetical protein [Streptomyces sp. NPDC048606]|uniref:hypothetical protein n=1 Tax=Streptomyces sp. NPDC048606 TaxID=3154726 RepID=UPI0034450CA2